MKFFIIEDNPYAQLYLSDLLSSNTDGASEIRISDGIASSLEILQSYRPDIVFLDVELRDGTAMELLMKIEKINFQIIFMTSYNKYAIDAFRFNACDFLLKPIEIDSLNEAIDKAKNNLKLIENTKHLAYLKEFFLNQSGGTKPEKLILRDKQALYVVQFSEIIQLISNNSYTTFFLKNDQQIVVSKSIGEYQEMLEDKGFIRVHQSHMVNVESILKYDKVNLELTVVGGAKVPVSHRKKEVVIEWITKNR